MRLTTADLDLERAEDTFEWEADDGTVFRFQDPRALPAQTLLELEQLGPTRTLGEIVADGRAQEMLDHKEVDGYLIEALMGRWAAHYGLGSLGEGFASPPTLNRQARRSRPTSRTGR